LNFAFDANSFRIDFDALGGRAEVVAAVGAHSLARLPGECLRALDRSEPDRSQ
jgi:hypothetical protein